MRTAALGGILTTMLLAGQACADVGGETVATVPAGATLDAVPLALLLDAGGGAMRVTSLEIRADVLRVHEWSSGYHYVGDVGVRAFPPGNATSEVHGAVLRPVDARLDGFLGIHPAQGDRVTFVPAAPAGLVAATRTEINPERSTGTVAPQRERNPDSVPYYYHAVDGPHLVAHAEGTLTFRGHGAIQVHGPDLLLASDEETRVIDTGTTAEARAVAGEVKQRWAVLEGENLTLRVTADAPWILALAEASTEGVRVTPEGVVLLPASAAPAPPAPGEASRPLVAPFALGAAVVAGATAVGGLAGLLAYRRRRGAVVVNDETESWDPEECLRRAHVHVEAERFDRALDWIGRARGLAPTSARAAATQAYVLERLGRLGEALAAYEEAARLAPHDGEPRLDAARLGLALGRPDDEAEAHLVAALGATPCLVHQVEETAAFWPLAARPALRRATEGAWAAFTRELSREEDASD